LNDDFDCSIEALSDGRIGWEDTPKCCHGSLVGLDPDTRNIKIIPITCGRWDCPDCAPRKASILAARIFAANPSRHVTLTWNPAVSQDPKVALETMKKALPKLANQIRKLDNVKNGHTIRKGTTFEYAASWEIHRSGLPHVHLATWGDYVPQAQLKKIWHSLTGAYIVQIKDMSVSFIGGHNWVKYLLKEHCTPKSLFLGSKLVTFSKNYHRNVQPKPPHTLGPNAFWVQVQRLPYQVVESLKTYFAASEIALHNQQLLNIPPSQPFPARASPLAYLLCDDNARGWTASLYEPSHLLPPEQTHSAPLAPQGLF